MNISTKNIIGTAELYLLCQALKKSVLALVLTVTVIAVNAQDSKQKYNRFSIGIKTTHLYDVYYNGYEELNNGFKSEDMKGLKGSKTNIDMAYGLDLSYFFTPILSLDAAFDIGKMSGANSLNYYKSDIRFYTLGANINLKNSSRNKLYRWVPYIRTSVSLAQYDVKQMLLEDDGILGKKKDQCIQTALGIGIRYHFTHNLLINLSGEFVTSYTDAWDGYDYGSGRDYMVKTALGIRYTFGKHDHIDRVPIRNNVPFTDSLDLLKEELVALREEIDQKLNNIQQPQSIQRTTINNNTNSTSNYNMELLKQILQIEMSRITFNRNSTLLSDEAKNTLSKIAQIMRENPDLKIIVNGYCDQDGSDEVNKRIAIQRAQNAANFLMQKGIDEIRLTVQGFGNTVLIDDENSPRAKSINRRVEFVVD